MVGLDRRAQGRVANSRSTAPTTPPATASTIIWMELLTSSSHMSLWRSGAMISTEQCHRSRADEDDADDDPRPFEPRAACGWLR